MKIGIIGATGKAGSMIAREARYRRHEVTAIVRNRSKIKDRDLKVLEKDLFDLTVEDLKPFDAVVDAFGTAFDPESAKQHQSSLKHLSSLMEKLPGVRLMVVGGAASLYTDRTHRHRVLESIPADWQAVPANMKAAFEQLQTSGANWTYFSPAATFDPKGPRTGKVRLGRNEVIPNSEGESYLSYTDYAVAMLDEIEEGRFIRKRFTAVSEKVANKDGYFGTESKKPVFNQEAVFYLNGQALDVFGPGRHTLKTQNLPLVSKVVNLATGGLNPFHCEVYFINKSEQMAIKWGTNSRVEFIEPTYKFPLSIGASGEMSLQVLDSKRLLVKIVGTESNLTQANLVKYFRSLLMTRVKSYIAQTIKSEKINIFEIDERLKQFSDSLKEYLVEDFKEYGISLRKFFVSSVIKPEGEVNYEKFKELHFRQYADIAEAKLRQQREIIDAQTEAQKTVIDSKAMATKRVQEGYTYQQERGFDVAEKVAENEAVGEFTNMGVGFGTMAGVGGAVGGLVGDMMRGAVDSTQAKSNMDISFCENCGAKLHPNSDFCEECGTPIKASLSYCTGCGYKFEREGKFCPKCGKKRG